MTATCDVQASGAIELYFYGELEGEAREAIERHLAMCAPCRAALEELKVIRAALAARPDVAAPASGDWSHFMARLEAAVAQERRAAVVASFRRPRAPHSYAAYLAMAALLALVTAGVALAVRSRGALTPDGGTAASNAVRTKEALRVEAGTGGGAAGGAADSAGTMAAISTEHFERSKLVVLGLATKDPAAGRTEDWAFERQLASTLLNDTRMYRLAAEDRGLDAIAGVMRDLEVVLLETSLTDEKDPAALPEIQRLIQKRDLLHKMEAVRTRGL